MHCLSATTPGIIGTPSRCCPEQAEFWRLGCASWRPAYLRLVRLPGIAPGRAPWQGAILLLDHNREIKRAGSFVLPARAISIKNKHLLAIYSIPTRGFTAAVSVFRGTPPAKPLRCKSVSILPRPLISDVWADPTRGKHWLSGFGIRLALSDIIETSCCFCSRTVHLSLLPFTFSFRAIKIPAYSR